MINFSENYFLVNLAFITTGLFFLNIWIEGSIYIATALLIGDILILNYPEFFEKIYKIFSEIENENGKN